MTGPLGSVGQQQKRGAEFYAKLQNAKGGMLGRKIELLIEDTVGNPATCVRKAQEMVERHDCRLFTGITLSSEALAIVPKLAEWNSIFISSDNGDGRLTAESFVPNFFRANTSGPDGRARGLALPQGRAKLKSFYALGMDYAWGHNSVQVFENEMKRLSIGLHRQGVRADRHQGLLDLRHQDPPVGRRRRLSRAGRRRQQRVPGAGGAIPACLPGWRC